MSSLRPMFPLLAPAVPGPITATDDAPPPRGTSTGHQRRTVLQRPTRGRATRIQLGRQELVLEAVRGGYVLLHHDGSAARRWSLGIPANGDLALVLRAPAHPLRITVRDSVTLAPRGRLRGYLTVPLVPTLLFCPHAATSDSTRDAPTAPEPSQESELVTLLPATLAAEWRDETGCVQCCASQWLWRFPLPTDEPRAVVPIVLRSRASRPWTPTELALQLTDRDLHELRGSLVANPQRIDCDDRGTHTARRSWPGQQGRA